MLRLQLDTCLLGGGHCITCHRPALVVSPCGHSVCGACAVRQILTSSHGRGSMRCAKCGCVVLRAAVILGASR